jgi:hypothetical protein
MNLQLPRMIDFSLRDFRHAEQQAYSSASPLIPFGLPETAYRPAAMLRSLVFVLASFRRCLNAKPDTISQIHALENVSKSKKMQ